MTCNEAGWRLFWCQVGPQQNSGKETENLKKVFFWKLFVSIAWRCHRFVCLSRSWKKNSKPCLGLCMPMSASRVVWERDITSDPWPLHLSCRGAWGRGTMWPSMTRTCYLFSCFQGWFGILLSLSRSPENEFWVWPSELGLLDELPIVFSQVTERMYNPC